MCIASLENKIKIGKRTIGLDDNALQECLELAKLRATRKEVARRNAPSPRSRSLTKLGQSLADSPLCPFRLCVVVLLLSRRRLPFTSASEIIISDHSSRPLQQHVLNSTSNPGSSIERKSRIPLTDRILALIDALTAHRSALKTVEAARQDGGNRLLFAKLLASMYLMGRIVDAQNYRVLIIVNDLGVDRLALLLVSQVYGLKVGYLYMAGQTFQRPPVPVHGVFAYDERQAKSSHTLEVPIALWARQMTLDSSSQVESGKLTLGILLNRYPAEDTVVTFAGRMSESSEFEHVMIRTHPGYEWKSRLPNEFKPEFCASEEPLAAFVSRCSIAIGAQTSALCEAIRLGTVSMVCGALDYLPEDGSSLAERLEIPAVSVNIATRDLRDAVLDAQGRPSPRRTEEALMRLGSESSFLRCDEVLESLLDQRI